MRLNITITRWMIALSLAITASAANADLVNIDPDDFPFHANLTSVAPGATLSTYRSNGLGGATFQPVYASAATWAPTGTQLFGHKGAPEYHWVNLLAASNCVIGNCTGDPFYVFRVDFNAPTDYVSVWTTMLEHAVDGAELWAFNSHNKRIAECRVRGVNNIVLSTGLMLNPVYGTGLNAPLPNPTACGAVVAKEDCNPSGPIGECSYIVMVNIERINRDIAYVMWGGTSATWTTSPVDNLTYNIPPP